MPKLNALDAFIRSMVCPLKSPVDGRPKNATTAVPSFTALDISYRSLKG